jgi:hypothetical protein
MFVGPKLREFWDFPLLLLSFGLLPMMHTLVKFSLAVVCLTTAVVAGQSARAASWIFQPSYYSHDPVVDVKIGPERYHFAGPNFTRPQGEFIRSGYRSVQGIIQVGNSGTDQLQYFESWVQGGVEF